MDPSTPSALVGTSIWDSTISILAVGKSIEEIDDVENMEL